MLEIMPTSHMATTYRCEAARARPGVLKTSHELDVQQSNCLTCGSAASLDYMLQVQCAPPNTWFIIV